MLLAHGNRSSAIELAFWIRLEASPEAMSTEVVITWKTTASAGKSSGPGSPKKDSPAQAVVVYPFSGGGGPLTRGAVVIARAVDHRCRPVPTGKTPALRAR